MTTPQRSLLLRAAAVIGGTAALLCLYLGALRLGVPMPKCIFHELTGLECPGCGSQRALMELLDGHPLDAWRRNLLLPFAVALIFLLWLLPPGSRLKERLTSRPAILTVLAVILLWWIIRNL